MARTVPLVKLKQKEGFYELPYEANSPEGMIKSLVRLPFVKHSKRNRKLSYETPLLKGSIHYSNLETGLWILHGNFDYFENVNYKKIDAGKIESDYYFLSIHVSRKKMKSRSPLINGETCSNQSWLLFKPGVNKSNCYFKDAKETNFTMYFSEAWLKRIVFKKTNFHESSLKNFFESDSSHLIWPDHDQETINLINKICDFFNQCKPSEPSFERKLKRITHQVLNKFLEKYIIDNVSDSFYEIADNDRKKNSYSGS